METRDLDPSILLVSLVYIALWLVARILDSQPEIFVVVCRSEGVYKGRNFHFYSVAVGGLE